MAEQLVMDRLEAWRGEGGPPTWCAAVERVIEAYRPLWTGREVNYGGNDLLAHGAIGVATAIYILAAEQNIPVGQVTRAQIEELCGRGTWDRVELWEAKLRELGHDPADEQDTVMARWRELREDIGPSDPWGLTDEAYYHVRIGSRLQNAVNPALAPRWEDLQL